MAGSTHTHENTGYQQSCASEGIEPTIYTPEVQIMTDRELLTIVSKHGVQSAVLQQELIRNPLHIKEHFPLFPMSFFSSFRSSLFSFSLLSLWPVGYSCQWLPEPQRSLYQLLPFPGVTFIALQLSHQSVKSYPC